MSANRDQPGYFRERQVERTEVSATTSLLRDSSYTVEVTIRNVSRCGFMAECGEPLRIGSHVELEVPGIGKLPAQVRWQLGNRMGGMFLDPVSLAHCEWVAVKAEDLAG